MNWIFTLLMLAHGATVCIAQSVTIYAEHAFGNCTNGSLSQDTINNPLYPDSIVWSTGFMGNSLVAPPGIYTWDAYVGGTLVNSGQNEIKQLDWYWAANRSWADIGNPIFTLSAEVPFYGTHIYQIPCCRPQQFDCIAELYQDGIMIDSNNNWFLPPSQGGAGIQSVSFTNGSGLYPPGYSAGHAYQIKFIDNGCGHMFWSDTMIANSCNNLQLDIQTAGSQTGFSNGSIDLLQVIPDTTEPYPIYSPVQSFSISLTKLYPSFTTISNVNAGFSSYTWSNLDSGFYQVCFIPEALCGVACDTVFVPGFATSVSDLTNENPVVYNSMTQEFTFRNATIGQFQVFDLTGSLVVETSSITSQISLGDFPSGVYLYKAVIKGKEYLGRVVK